MPVYKGKHFAYTRAGKAAHKAAKKKGGNGNRVAKRTPKAKAGSTRNA